MMAEYKSHNITDKLYTNPEGVTLDYIEMTKIYNFDYVDFLFGLASKLQGYNLSEDELILLQYVAIFSRGKYRQTGINIQEAYIQNLLKHSIA